MNVGKQQEWSTPRDKVESRRFRVVVSHNTPEGADTKRVYPLQVQWVRFSPNLGVTNTGRKKVSQLRVGRSGCSAAQSTGTRCALPGWVQRERKRSQKTATEGVTRTDQIFRVRKHHVAQNVERVERSARSAWSFRSLATPAETSKGGLPATRGA